MFRHQMFHPQGACLVTLLNYISTIAAFAKFNKVFKILKLSSVIKWLLLHEVWWLYIQSVTNMGFINI